MSVSASTTIHSRREQMFPILAPLEIDRLRRFGEACSYAAGRRIVKAGDIAPGLVFIRAGKVGVTHGGGLTPREEIVTYGPGQFLGELAQLSDRRAHRCGPLRPVRAIVPSAPARPMVQEAAR